MRCPNCDSENNDGAKFCKKCGTPLKNNTMTHESVINSVSGKSSDNTTKYIIVALIIVAVVLAGAFVYIYGFGNNGNNSQDTSAPIIQNNDKKAQMQIQMHLSHIFHYETNADKKRRFPSSVQKSALSGRLITGCFD